MVVAAGLALDALDWREIGIANEVLKDRRQIGVTPIERVNTRACNIQYFHVEALRKRFVGLNQEPELDTILLLWTRYRHT